MQMSVDILVLLNWVPSFVQDFPIFPVTTTQDSAGATCQNFFQSKMQSKEKIFANIQWNEDKMVL